MSRFEIPAIRLRVREEAGSVGSIHDTAVLPAYRRRGLGRWGQTESLTSLRRARPLFVPNRAGLPRPARGAAPGLGRLSR